MLEIDALNKRSVKLIVSFLLCFVFVFSFFAITIEKSEAIATIPLVAIPIIKLLIASGITFLSVDAMLEVYNLIKGTTYYNTLTGNILNMLDVFSEDLVDACVFHDLAMGDQIPPEFPEWPNLLLGTLALEIIKSDNFFQDFLDWFGGFKDDLSEDPLFDVDRYVFSYDSSVDGNSVSVSNGNHNYLLRRDSYTISLYLDNVGITYYHTGRFGLDGRPYYSSNSYLSCSNGSTDNIRTQNNLVQKYAEMSITKQSDRYYIWYCNGALFREYYIYFVDLPFLSSELDVYYPTDEFGLIIGDIEIDTDDNFQNDDSEEKVEIYVPMPNEVITYDPDTGLDIDFDTEISIEEFEELMTPYVGSTWEDIKQDKPIPSKIPTDVPYPDDPVVPDPLIPEMPDLGEDDLPPDAGEGDDPFAGADEEEKIDWDPLKGINLHKKFPFCIPWDLYDSFKSFDVQGEPPKWEIKYLDDVEFIIDFAIFEPWAVIVRWGLLIIFNIGLIIITRNLIRG